jgi:hypothetical protein
MFAILMGYMLAFEGGLYTAFAFHYGKKARDKRFNTLVNGRARSTGIKPINNHLRKKLGHMNLAQTFATNQLTKMIRGFANTDTLEYLVGMTVKSPKSLVKGLSL